MDIEFLLRRQAVMDWRDRWFTQTVSTINAAAISARADFAALLEAADAIETIRDPAGFVYGHIDASMTNRLNDRLPAFCKAASDELRCIEERFVPLGDALAESWEALLLPNSIVPVESLFNAVSANPGSPFANAKSSHIPRSLKRLTSFMRDHSLTRAAQAIGSKASQKVAASADTLGKTIQDKSGFYARLRRMAGDRIASAWMGDAGTPLPLKAQMLTLLDEVASEARSFNL
jgi:hypothetical protein